VADPPTSWDLIRGAAAGRSDDRAEFVRVYTPVVRAYLGARWRGSPLAAEVDDAAQEVFVDCFEADGALTRAEAARTDRFRAFLYGVTRVAALRIERERNTRRRVEGGGADSVIAETAADDPSLSRVFDRAWAGSLLRRAGVVQSDHARNDPEARRRVELLHLRFRDGLPLREIAARWDVEPAWLHHQYATAREEFRRALLEVVRAECGAEGVEKRCSALLEHFFS
jgi:DNA-directed RNA polymerase specialized sigma24 family protein